MADKGLLNEKKKVTGFTQEYGEESETHWREGRPYEEYDEEGISLKELLLVLIQGRRTIALVTAVVLVVTMIGSVLVPNINIGTKGEVQTVVQLYFPGIEKGQNPDGMVYNVNEIKSAEVLQDALDHVQLSNPHVSVTQLNNNISFTSIIPDDAAKTLQNISDLKTEQLKLERLEKLEIIPNSYIVTLNVSNNLGITKEEGREILDNILLSYKNWLIEKYSGYTVMPDVFAGDFDLEDYDYIQAADMMDQQLSDMRNYINTNFTDKNFHSGITGLSADDLISALDALQQTHVEKLYTMIGTYYITRDASKVVAIYENLSQEKSKLASQNNEKAAALQNSIRTFQANEKTVIMGNTQDEPIKIQTESEQYNRFVTQYIDAGSRAAAAAVDAAYFMDEANRFAAAPYTYGPDSAEAKETEQIFQDTREKLTYWTGLIKDMGQEYYNQVTYEKYAEQLIPAKDYNMGSSVNLPLNLAIGLVLGLVAGTLLVLFREYMGKDLKEIRDREVTTDGE